MRAARSSGFTLIEVLVALSIFAMLAGASVMLLRSSVEAQAVSAEHLDDMAGLRRATSLMTADLAQAVPRLPRDEIGGRQPAFLTGEGSGPDMLISFTRGGVTTGEGAVRQQRIAYLFRDGALMRQSYDVLDGGQPGEAVVLIEGLASVAVEVRNEDGFWADSWAPELPATLPGAVAFELSPAEGGAPLRMLFWVGADQ